MIKRRGSWKRFSVFPLLGALIFAGCGSGQQKTDGLEKLGAVHAVTREADSGTRATFDDLTGITSENTGIEAAGSTGDMLKAVGDSSSIGYLTGEAADESVKILKVNGKDIKDRKYPLIRNLYVVYKGELTDLKEDFITYVTGKGQEIVGKHFETVKTPGTFLSMKPAGTLRIGGSSTEAPMMEELAEAYQKDNPNARIIVDTTDSGTGINNTLSGSYDLGMSSRNPKSYEQNLLTFETVARDRIAVITGKDNPLENITIDQLKGIYSGRLKNWADLPAYG